LVAPSVAVSIWPSYFPAQPTVEVGDCVDLHVDPGRKGRILRLKPGCGSAALVHIGRDKLSTDARRADDGEPSNERHEDETPHPCGGASGAAPPRFDRLEWCSH
jgi:hypothetical protein